MRLFRPPPSGAIPLAQRPPARGLLAWGLLAQTLLALILAAGLPQRAAHAVTQEDRIRVAVAANFLPALREIAAEFEARTGHQVVTSSGSTGRLYAQIRNGAPFDVFLSADAERPRLLEEGGLGVPGSRFPYALGRLVLWSPRTELLAAGGPEALEAGAFRRLALANPALAPYGAAARETLQALGLWTRLEGRLVRGENIAQAYALVATGNAPLGFVARSQILQATDPIPGATWLVPNTLHAPIRQDAILLARARDSLPAQAFLAALKRPETRDLLVRLGYDVPLRPPARPERSMSASGRGAKP